MPRFLISLLFLSSSVYSNIQIKLDPPKMHVAKGCPCLDCPYFVKGQAAGIWKARRETPLYSTPGGTLDQISIVPQGSSVVALSGEIHTDPGELSVIFTSGRYKLGSKVYILQEDADTNTWKIWYDGKEYFENLSLFVGKKEPCKKPSEKCWAKVVKSLKMVWWVNLRTKERVSGWTNLTDDYEFDRSSCME